MDDRTHNRLVALREEMGEALERAERHLAPGMKVAFIAYHPEQAGREILLTNGEPREVAVSTWRRAVALQLGHVLDRGQNVLEETNGKASVPDPFEALKELLDAIVEVGGYEDLEGGQAGDGPVVLGYRALGLPLPDELAQWFQESGVLPDTGLMEDEAP